MQTLMIPCLDALIYALKLHPRKGFSCGKRWKASSVFEMYSSLGLLKMRQYAFVWVVRLFVIQLVTCYEMNLIGTFIFNLTQQVR